jgi:hypothetical protein
MKFENFLADMGQRPPGMHGKHAAYSIDRFPKKSGDYKPSNCRWATKSQQMDNRRRTLHVKYKAKKSPLAKVLRERKTQKALKQNTFKRRLDMGWSVDRALNTPVERYSGYTEHTVVINGKKMSLHEAAKLIGVKYDTIHHRVHRRGWDPLLALTTPVRKWTTPS